MVFLIVILIVVLILAGYVVSLYNSLIVVKNNADKAMMDIDIVLKQRHDELPKLLETCKGYMKYEQNLLSTITELRSSLFQAKDAQKKAELDNQLSASLKSLFAVAENYPELKANQNFVMLQQRISDLENKLSTYRLTYNSAANTFNILIEQIPYNFIAAAINYRKKDMLIIPAEEKKDVEIKF